MKLNQIDNEIWKPIKGYNGFYEISNLGRIRAHNSSGAVVRKPHTTKNGYLAFPLWKGGKCKTRRVHVLVLETFVGPKPGLEVNHKNFDKKDNCLENLEWVSRQDNIRYNVINKRHLFHETHGMSKLTYLDVATIRANPFSESQRQLAKQFNVCHSTIGRIIRKQSWK